MNYLARALALAGLALAVYLYWSGDPAAVWALIAQAGFGIVLAALLHVFPMTLNARAWHVILPRGERLSLRVMLLAVWIRESVNGLLPVARVGGEIVSYRLLRIYGMRRFAAAAGLVVDMALSVLSQLVFALAGVAFWIAHGQSSTFAGQIGFGLVVMLVLATLFVIVQRAGAFETITRVANRMASGRLEQAVGHSARIDRAVRTMYRRRNGIASCFLWQLAGWLAGAAEIAAALYFLGHPVSIADALAIEALIQAISSAAFVVPGALGVQEAGFLAIGAAFGIDARTALALAAARRVRDVIVFFPGLVAWQVVERRTQRTREPSTPIRQVD
jgi:putative membrane protein